jgi:hypothetical protein
MKITLEPRKTTWVPFVDCNAKLEIEWTVRIAYNKAMARENTSHSAFMRYIFNDLEGAQFVPSSQLIIKENGIPLVITQSVASPVKDRFRSERIVDPFVEIGDRVAQIEKSEVATKQLSKGVVERSWTDTINRSIRMENKTGKEVLLKLTVLDRPAEELVFVSSTPKADSKEQPEYRYNVQLKSDEVKTIKIELKLKNVEKIESPPEGGRPLRPMGTQRSDVISQQDVDSLLESVSDETQALSETEELIQEERELPEETDK